MAQFAIENLSFTYPGAADPAVDGATLSVPRGAYLVVCGKSGCGKTTLLRHLKTALQPHGTRSGRVLFEGSPLEEVPQRQQTARIGFVMQDPEAQVVTDKVWHELAFGLESLGCDQRTMRVRVAEMASYFGIQDWFHRDVRDLSGGQKQLLNLASIMAMQPSCLVLDEPTSQLDPIAAASFLDTVRRINRELGTTVILSEHRLEQVFPAADRVVVMDQGRITFDGDPRTVGLQLCRTGHDLGLAVPAPLRIYQGVCDSPVADGRTVRNKGSAQSGAERAAVSVEQSNESNPEARVRTDAEGMTAQVPLTVREGRMWLARRYGAHGGNSAVASAGTPSGSGRAAEQDASDKAVLPSALADPPLEEDFDPVLEAKEVWFRYDRNAPDVLRDVNLQVPVGVLQAVVGGNGTGKSTLLRALCGVVAPYRGTIRVNGRKLKGRHGGGIDPGSIALLPQDPSALFLHTTVRDDLMRQAQAQAAQGDTRGRAQRSDSAQGSPEAAVAAVAARLDITGILDRHPFDLSGGEQQRAALAKVLLCHPQILLLDEPTKGVDEYLKARLAALFDELTGAGVTVLMASHDIEFCARHADRVSMFFDGSVITTNTPRRFFSENSFYTTAANRMARDMFPHAITDEEVVRLCRRA